MAEQKPNPGYAGAAPVVRLRADVDEAQAVVCTAVDDSGNEVGMAAAGVTRDVGGPTDWELYSVNVVAAQRGTGLADALLAATVGERAASVWVLVSNARARGFYRRHGFTADGARRIHAASGEPEIRLVRRPHPDPSRSPCGAPRA